MSETATIAANPVAPTAARPDQTRKNVPHREATKPDTEEFRIRVHFCFNLLAQGRKPWQVRKLFCKKFKVSPRSAFRYLSRARKLVAKQINIPLVDLKNESLAIYRAVSIDPAASRSERLAARKALDDLMGIRSPREHIITGRGKSGAVAVENRTPQLVVNVVQVSAAAIASPGPPAVSECGELLAGEPAEQIIPAASEPLSPPG